MNKAFVREPEQGDPRCPGCDATGPVVGSATLEAHAAGSNLSAPACYCESPNCSVAYFDRWGTTVAADRISGPAWPKLQDAPVCSCFGVTAAEIEADARAGRMERIRGLIERSRTPEAKCGVLAPSGRCCVPTLRRLFSEATE